jgi:hypothetical protein
LLLILLTMPQRPVDADRHAPRPRRSRWRKGSSAAPRRDAKRRNLGTTGSVLSAGLLVARRPDHRITPWGRLSGMRRRLQPFARIPVQFAGQSSGASGADQMSGRRPLGASAPRWCSRYRAGNRTRSTATPGSADRRCGRPCRGSSRTADWYAVVDETRTVLLGTSGLVRRGFEGMTKTALASAGHQTWIW